MRIVPILAGLLLLTACAPPSEASVEEAGRLPGVVSVDAWFEEGDDDIPWQSDPPWIVEVELKEDVTAAEAAAVLDAYAGYLDEEDVALVRLSVRGPKHVAAEVGGSVPATAQAAEDLVAAQHDDRVRSYDVGGWTAIELAPTSLPEVVAWADRYHDAYFLVVSTADHVVSRDSLNDDPEPYAARRAFALEVAARYDVLASEVRSDGQLTLVVPEEQEQEVRALAGAAGDRLGVVVVRGP